MRNYVCGGTGDLSPEARAELRLMDDYLKAKAKRAKAGQEPLPPFEEWRDSYGITLFDQRVCRHMELGCVGSCRGEYACDD
jgi:hypothetical protein